jgi:hypothetical protein
VAPAPDFGTEILLVDALRPQHEVARLPLKLGDEVWVAVRRFHVLAPASLRLLVDSGASPGARAAAEFGKSLAERLDAQTSTLTNGTTFRSDGRLDPASYEIGAETEHAEEGFDVLVLGTESDQHIEKDLRWIHQVRHHILLVSAPAGVPARVLVCVTVGEHGKTDVLFAERLAWQLGAAATVLTVLPEDDEAPEAPAHVERFVVPRPSGPRVWPRPPAGSVVDRSCRR